MGSGELTLGVALTLGVTASWSYLTSMLGGLTGTGTGQ
jgi:hypothetical protein